MSTRATIVCASLGAAVLLTAAQVTIDLPPASQSAQILPQPLVQQVMGASATASPSVDTSSAHYKLLSAIYGRPQYASAESAMVSSVEEPTLWLARVIYSETKKPHEQELVAWVVRNRVETQYRGETTYRDVVLDPYQFSAFNPGSPKRHFYRTLTPDMQLPGWQRAISIAHYVRHADPAYRPFSVKTRHFFSERSMTGRRFPGWAEGHSNVSPGWNYTIDTRRFRFYAKIS